MPGFQWNQLLLALIVGAILGMAGTFLSLNNRIAMLEGQWEARNRNLPTAGTVTAPASGTTAIAAVLPAERLLDIVKTAQETHVKASWGELAGQSFTDADLQAFQSRGRAQIIAAGIAETQQFQSVVRALRSLDQLAQQKLLESARQPLHPTWQEMGYISRDGQTDAGQMAERLIAAEIVDRVKGELR